MSKAKTPATESRDRVFIGVALMERVKELADKHAEKHGFRPTPQQMIEMLITKAKG